jgi:HPt (histidine-containing phosphotransfer) domain-containing protein
MCASSDSPATIDALIEAFVEDGHARMLEMERSLHARDLVALADVAHELLGSSGTIGAVALSGAVGGVQRQAAVALGRPAVEPVDVEDLGRLLALMATEFHRAETALRAAASGGR